MLVAGRRFGKTYLSIPELMRMAWGPDREAWYIAPTYKQAKLTAWRPLKRLARPFIVGKPNETELAVDLVSGGRIRLMGADNYDSLRGAGLDGAVLDEYADIAPEAWQEVIRPMLADRKGSALFIGTPEGFNHFYELYREAEGRPGWSRWQFTTIQGGNVEPEEIEDARRTLSDKVFRQEFEASFENLYSGRVYYAFDRNAHRQPVELDPALPLCWAVDFNVNPMCSAILQEHKGIVRVLREIILPDSNTFEAVEEFVRIADEYRDLMPGERWARPMLPVVVYGDAAGEARSTGGRSDWQIIRDQLGKHADKFSVSVRKRGANPAVKDRVNAVNAMLRNAAGETRLLIHPQCRELVADLEQVAWKTDPHGNITGQIDKSDSKRTHVSDALGYMVEYEFPLKGRIGFRPEYLGV